MPRACWLLVLIAALSLVVACSGGDSAAPDSPTAAPTSAPTAAPIPTGAPAQAAQPTAPPAMAGDKPATITVSDATVARYRVGEQLARRNLPNDAVGETPDVEGAIVFTSEGSVDADLSRITIGLAGLTSDEGRRDRYVREQLFETSKFPNAYLAVTGVQGMPWPLPDSGDATFQITGDLTLRDVSRPVTWDVTAQFDGGSVTGQATTVVTFEQFEMSKPMFGFILSVEDEIRLEIDVTASVDSG